MPPRRPPPGGASTFSFGPADPPPAAQGAYDGEGLPPDARHKITQFMGEVTDVKELVSKVQAEFATDEEEEGEKIGTEGPIVMGPRGFRPAGEKVQQALAELHSRFAARGCDTLLRLGKKFHIMDDNSDYGLGFDEFKKGLKESGIILSESSLHALFRYFDMDCSGYISFDEFMLGVRPELNERRANLVAQVFAAMDVNNDGAITVQDVQSKYDVSLHPDVVAGTHTEVEVLQSFLTGFDGSLGPKSAVVTPEKFAAYYANVSASIDDDDYFELMMRNVWHLSGGEGWTANTTCRRLLVTHEDGTQTVEVVENDVNVSRDDLSEIKERLREQGVGVVKVALYGYVEQGATSILSSSSTPKKTVPVVPQTASTEAEPESVVKTYKQRMAASNVNFA